MVVNGDRRYSRDCHLAEQFVVVDPKDGDVLWHAQPCGGRSRDYLLRAAVMDTEQRCVPRKLLQPPRKAMCLQREVVLLANR